jgi:hypothetical protein
LSLASYSQIADKVEALDTDCPKCVIKPPKAGVRKVYAGFSYCWAHMSRSSRALAKRTSNFKTAQRYGFYTRDVYDSIKLLRNQAELFNETHRLYDHNILEELALARLMLAGWLKKHAVDEDIPLPDILSCIKMIAQVAEVAQKISKLDSKRGELSPEMIDGIVTAITHAFHKANFAPTDVARAQIFASEIARLFAGATATINSTTIPITDPANFSTRLD